MEDLLFAVICSPFALITSVLNVIFILCLHYPVAGVNLHQPLRFLLIAMISNSTIQQGTTLLTVLLTFLNAPEHLLIVLKALIYLTYCSCFSTSAWISIFYYIKIVPLHCAILIWIKKNIRVVVYSGFIWDQTVLLAAMAMGAVPHLRPSPHFFNLTSGPLNGTMPAGQDNLNLLLNNLCNIVFLLYIIFPLFTLTVSWIRTFVYLRGHIKRMKSTTTFSSPQQQNQMRVTVMGIVQAAVFLPSCLWTLFTVLVYATPMFDRIDSNKHLTLTVTSISDLANIVCLGFSQSVFRLRIAAKWKGFREALGLLDRNEDIKA